MTRRELAINNFYKGYNCSQSIVLAFSDLTNIDNETLLSLSSPFGGGMGRLREVCGAFSGALIIVGLLSGYSTPGNIEIKNKLYEKVQELAAEFESKNETLVCRDLLGLTIKHDEPKSSPRTNEFYSTRPCAMLIGDMAEILDNFLKRYNSKD